MKALVITTLALILAISPTVISGQGVDIVISVTTDSLQNKPVISVVKPASASVEDPAGVDVQNNGNNEANSNKATMLAEQTALQEEQKKRQQELLQQQQQQQQQHQQNNAGTNGQKLTKREIKQAKKKARMEARQDKRDANRQSTAVPPQSTTGTVPPHSPTDNSLTVPKEMYKEIIYEEKHCMDYQTIAANQTGFVSDVTLKNFSLGDYAAFQCELYEAAIRYGMVGGKQVGRTFWGCRVTAMQQLETGRIFEDVLMEPVWDCTIVDYVDPKGLSNIISSGLTFGISPPNEDDPEFQKEWDLWKSHTGTFATIGGIGAGIGAMGQLSVEYDWFQQTWMHVYILEAWKLSQTPIVIPYPHAQAYKRHTNGHHGKILAEQERAANMADATSESSFNSAAEP